MTAQEIFEDCGFLLVSNEEPMPLGPFRVTLPGIVQPGITLVAIEEVDRSVAEEYWNKYNTQPHSPYCKYFYKAIAE